MKIVKKFGQKGGPYHPLTWWCPTVTTEAGTPPQDSIGGTHNGNAP